MKSRLGLWDEAILRLGIVSQLDVRNVNPHKPTLLIFVSPQVKLTIPFQTYKKYDLGSGQNDFAA
jgi:hypothetical protein